MTGLRNRVSIIYSVEWNIPRDSRWSVIIIETNGMYRFARKRYFGRVDFAGQMRRFFDRELDIASQNVNYNSYFVI
jgi:hypothetical protein